MQRLAAVSNFIDGLNDKVGALVGWLTTILVLVVCYDVFTRYVLQKSSLAVQELEWHLFAVIFLTGAAYTLRHDRHVRVDVLYLKFSPRTRAWVNFFGCLIFLIPFTILVIFSSKTFVLSSMLMGEISPDPGGLPARFILKAFIPLGFFLLFLQAISLAFRSLVTALRSEPVAEEQVHE